MDSGDDSCWQERVKVTTVGNILNPYHHDKQGFVGIYQWQRYSRLTSYRYMFEHEVMFGLQPSALGFM